MGLHVCFGSELASLRATKAAVRLHGCTDLSEPKLPQIRPNKRIPVFSVTRPYLNLLVKSRFFSGFLEKI